MSDTVPIDDERDGRDVTGLAAWRILEPFGAKADADVLESIRERLPWALQDFPALAHETVNVGLLPPSAEVSGRAYGYNRLICLPHDQPTANMTLWHELGHVAIWVRLQDGEDVPKTSEEFCSIFSVARMPPDAVDRDYIAYLGEPDAPRAEWPEICRRALAYREDHHDYIQQCKEWLGIRDGGGT